MCIQYRLGGSICLTVMAICKGIEIDTKQAYSPEGIIVACCCMYREERPQNIRNRFIYCWLIIILWHLINVQLPITLYSHCIQLSDNTIQMAYVTHHGH